MYVRLAFAVPHTSNRRFSSSTKYSRSGMRISNGSVSASSMTSETGGRTVLFVSHNLAAVQRLCKRAILLRHGRIVDQGPVGHVVRSTFAPARKMPTCRSFVPARAGARAGRA